MPWLIAAISSYFLLAFVALVDKYLLAGPFPNPKVYSFYVGMLGVLALVLIPFVNFQVPEPFLIILSLGAGVFFVLGLFWYYKALNIFEASRVIPAIGGLLPIFSLVLVYIISPTSQKLSSTGILAFFLLISGSILISLEKKRLVTIKSLQLSAVAAFFLALCFVLSKYAYSAQSFWSGFIWIRLGGVLAALFFIFTKEVKSEFSNGKKNFEKKTGIIFLSNQAVGACASILQNLAIFLAPVAYVAIINALQGTQYLFLLVFVVIISFKFPQVLKEKTSGTAVFQKILASVLIGAGLYILSLK